MTRAGQPRLFAFPSRTLSCRCATIRRMTAADLVHVGIALFGGGGAWLLGREIARQVGETKREKIRQDAETTRLAIKQTMQCQTSVGTSDHRLPERIFGQS